MAQVLSEEEAEQVAVALAVVRDEAVANHGLTVAGDTRDGPLRVTEPSDGGYGLSVYAVFPWPRPAGDGRPRPWAVLLRGDTGTEATVQPLYVRTPLNERRFRAELSEHFAHLVDYPAHRAALEAAGVPLEGVVAPPPYTRASVAAGVVAALARARGLRAERVVFTDYCVLYLRGGSWERPAFAAVQYNQRVPDEVRIDGNGAVFGSSYSGKITDAAFVVHLDIDILGELGAGRLSPARAAADGEREACAEDLRARVWAHVPVEGRLRVAWVGGYARAVRVDIRDGPVGFLEIEPAANAVGAPLFLRRSMDSQHPGPRLADADVALAIRDLAAYADHGAREGRDEWSAPPPPHTEDSVTLYIARTLAAGSKFARRWPLSPEGCRFLFAGVAYGVLVAPQGPGSLLRVRILPQGGAEAPWADAVARFHAGGRSDFDLARPSEARALRECLLAAGEAAD